MKISRNPDGRCYHVNIKKGEIPPQILVCGAPERVDAAAAKLEEATFLSRHRGLPCAVGNYKGTPITVACSGMGPASTAIVLPELLDSVAVEKDGSVSLLRLGTAGALQSEIKTGHLVVSQGAVRDEATTDKWVAKAYPSVAGTRISLALLAAAMNAGYQWQDNLWHGITHVKDELYATEFPDGTPLAEQRQQALHSFQQMGVLATAMEFTVFTLLADMLTHKWQQEGRSSGCIEAGCLLFIVSEHPDGDNAEPNLKPMDPGPSIDVALEALHLEAQWKKGTLPESINKTLLQLGHRS